MIIRYTVAEDWPWIKLRANPILCIDTVGIAACRGSEIQAMVVMDSWAPNSCAAHIAIENPFVLRRGFLEEVFHYAFITRGKRVMVGVTPADNARALRFNHKVGFSTMSRIRDGYKVGVDYVLQEMRKETCRWLPAELREAA